MQAILIKVKNKARRLAQCRLINGVLPSLQMVMDKNLPIAHKHSLWPKALAYALFVQFPTAPITKAAMYPHVTHIAKTVLAYVRAKWFAVVLAMPNQDAVRLAAAIALLWALWFVAQPNLLLVVIKSLVSLLGAKAVVRFHISLLTVVMPSAYLPQSVQPCDS